MVLHCEVYGIGSHHPAAAACVAARWNTKAMAFEATVLMVE